MKDILAMFWAAFGPLVTELLKKLLESLLNKAAKKLPAASTYATPTHAMVALIEQAIADCPPRAFARRSFLRVARNKAGTVAQGHGFTNHDFDEISDAVNAASREKI